MEAIALSAEGTVDSFVALEVHLQEQREALRDVLELLADDQRDDDLLQMRHDLEDTIAELENILRASSGARAESSKQDGVQVGKKYRFRNTDGRWYDGVVEAFSGSGVQMRFLKPTKMHMLDVVTVPRQLLKTFRSNKQLSGVQIGSTVLACPGEGALWEAAEVASIGSGGTSVVFQSSGTKQVLPPGCVAASAFASDSDGDSQDAERMLHPEPEAGGLPVERLDSSEEDDDTDEETLGDLSRRSGLAATKPPPPQGGTQTETVTFAGWEGHTRGIASKLMAGMGYVMGAALGARKQGILDPIQVQVFRPQAGLGSQGADLGRVGNSSNQKRRRGGEKARRRKQAKVAFLEREARRNADVQAERETGTTGVFALLNQRLGDDSEAAEIQRRTDRKHSKRLAQGEESKFEAELNGKPQPPLQNRKSLVAGQDEVSAARSKISRLREMAKRNTKDAVIAKQVAAKLAEAKDELRALEKRHSSSMAALQSKEKHKQWLKF